MVCVIRRVLHTQVTPLHIGCHNSSNIMIEISPGGNQMHLAKKQLIQEEINPPTTWRQIETLPPPKLVLLDATLHHPSHKRSSCISLDGLASKGRLARIHPIGEGDAALRSCKSISINQLH